MRTEYEIVPGRDGSVRNISRARFFTFLRVGGGFLVAFGLAWFVRSNSAFISNKPSAELPSRSEIEPANFLQVKALSRAVSLEDSFPESVSADVDFNRDPCSNFYEFACGRWINETLIPPDKAGVGLSFDAVSYEVEDELKELYEESYSASSEYRKIHDWYSSCMNLSLIEERGASPLKPYLEKIQSIKTKQDLDDVLVYLMLWKIHPFIGLGVERGTRNATIHVLNLRDPTLFFPVEQYQGWPIPSEEWWNIPGSEHRDFVELRNESNLKSRAKAERYYKHINELAGYSSDQAELAAVRSIWIETSLAVWVDEDRTRASANYNPAGPELIDLPTIEAQYPNIPWRAFFEAFSRACAERNLSCANSALDGRANLAVRAPYFYSQLSDALGTRPPSRWIPYLRTATIHTLMPYLSSAFYTASLDLVTEVQGIQALPPRHKICVGAASGALPVQSERLYIERYFPPAAQATGGEMLRFIKAAFVERMELVDWMDNSTNRRALSKAQAMQMNLGGPASRFTLDSPVDAGDYFGNAQNADRLHILKGMHLLDRRVERSHWPLTATAANAMYRVDQNAVFIPAAIMQPPFFSDAYDMARNFGGVGAVIGHEMTHGFDSTGRRYDAAGEFDDWWDPQSEARFLRRTGCLEKLYSGFTIAGVRLAGRRVLRENIADSGGVAIALRAYRAWHRAAHAGAPPPAEGERLFFAAFGQLWCEKDRRQQARLLAFSEQHAPSVFRCNGVASQSADFAAAYACPPGSPMNPLHKCVVW